MQKNRLLSYLLHRIDMILFLIFIPILYITATQLTSPAIASSGLLWKIPTIFVGSIVFTDLFLKWISSHKKHFPQSVEPLFSALKPQKITFVLIMIFSMGLTIALFASWATSLKTYIHLFPLGTSSALRAITTGLHKLVPLESRLFYTVMPALLLYPFYTKAARNWKALTWILMIFIGFITTTKLSILYGVAFTAIYLWTKESFLIAKSIWPKILLPIGLIILAIGFFQIIKQSGNGPEAMLKKSYLPALSQPPTTESTVSKSTSCEGKGDYDIWMQKGQAAFLVYRTFGISAEVIRLFICLRESGWQPNYQGHQSARLIGQYQPYYRWAYGELRPGRGSTIGSAVTNVSTDSYFNLGLVGVIISGVLIGGIYHFLLWITQHSMYTRFSYLIRINFFLILASGSMLSAIVSVAPIFVTLCCDYLIGKIRKI